MKNLNSLQKAMLKALLLLVCLFAITAATAQTEYKIQGNEIVKVQDSTKAKAQPVKTGLIHKIKNVSYPVFKSVRGSYFILRTSKKTGKQYKQYLKISK
jgi:hypothetical protein